MSSEANLYSTSLEDTVSDIDNTPRIQHPGMIGYCAWEMSGLSGLARTGNAGMLCRVGHATCECLVD